MLAPLPVLRPYEYLVVPCFVTHYQHRCLL